jgi:hypothetical protein
MYKSQDVLAGSVEPYCSQVKPLCQDCTIKSALDLRALLARLARGTMEQPRGSQSENSLKRKVANVYLGAEEISVFAISANGCVGRCLKQGGAIRAQLSANDGPIS